MQQTASIQKKAFLSAIIILSILLIATGIVVRFIPTGTFDYELINGIETIIPGTFQYTNQDPLPLYRILTAPFEVLAAPGNALVIAIILFLLIIGGSIKVLKEANIIEHFIYKIILRYYQKRYLLLALITLVFMSVGAFIGVFEEIVPLVPIMIILAKKLGWDTKTGLGMSILAAGFGFSAAITNPFTIGVAQQLAGLPLFSGFFYRMLIFIIIYSLLVSFLIHHAKKISTNHIVETIDFTYQAPHPFALKWTILWLSMMFISIILSPFVPLLQSYNLILITLYFLIAGLGVALVAFPKKKEGLNMYLKGAIGMAPGIILILLATGVKQIIVASEVLDTILYRLSTSLVGSNDGTIIVGAYGFVLFANFFIGSGSAKAFLIMPILNPLLDLSEISRQLGVLAFQLGDGFSNMFYPTNAVLLVSLGLAEMSYTKWFKWTVFLQLIIILLSIGFLFLGLGVGY